MSANEQVYVACTISRSGFSGERIYSVKLADGTEHVGVAPVDYCVQQGRAPLGFDEPAKDQSLSGFTEGRKVAVVDGIAWVEMPDGETIKIRQEQIAYVGKKEMEYVSVGS